MLLCLIITKLIICYNYWINILLISFLLLCRATPEQWNARWECCLIFNRKLECHFPYVQISSAALWLKTSAAYSVSHPTTWHLCSYSKKFLTFWMGRLFARGKMSLSPSHLPSGRFHLSDDPTGQMGPLVSPRQQAQKHGLVPGQNHAHTHILNALQAQNNAFF